MEYIGLSRLLYGLFTKAEQLCREARRLHGYWEYPLIA